MNKIMIKKIFCSLLMCILLSGEVYAGSIFNELVKAIKERYVKIQLAEVEKKYKDENIEGRAYMINITHDVSGQKMVTLSTEKDTNHPDSVRIIVYLRKYYDKHLSRFKIGDRVYCFGPFKEFRMRSIVIGEGFIK